ncbi:MAG: globin domain-containing protein [Granulosicoccaceae bacterium]
MEALSIKELFLESLGRCQRNEGFIPSFYARLMASSELVKYKFRHTNFEKQNQMLVRSLELVAGVVCNEQEALQELRHRAETHDHAHLNIKPDLYECWQVSLIATAEEVDPEWDEATERAWNVVLDSVVNHMIKLY